LATSIAVALVRGETDATDREIDQVRRSVARSIDAMPDFMRLGVRTVSAVAGLALFAQLRAPFHTAVPQRQARLAASLAGLPLPGVAEFLRLTRGLGLVALYESRSADVADGVAAAR
jgi:hypothetical protein